MRLNAKQLTEATRRITAIIKAAGGSRPCTCGWDNGNHEDRCDMVTAWDRAADELDDADVILEPAGEGFNSMTRIIAVSDDARELMLLRTGNRITEYIIVPDTDGTPYEDVLERVAGVYLEAGFNMLRIR